MIACKHLKNSSVDNAQLFLVIGTGKEILSLIESLPGVDIISKSNSKYSDTRKELRLQPHIVVNVYIQCNESAAVIIKLSSSI